MHDKIEYLGHFIKHGELYVAIKTVEALQKTTPPKKNTNSDF